MSLRPSKLGDFIGQPHIKDLLTTAIEAAKLYKKPLRHTLLVGPAGIGKTTLALIIAAEMGVKCKTINGATLQGLSEIESVFRNLDPFDVIFIDEIHRLSRHLEEFLYHPMEDGVMTERVEIIRRSNVADIIEMFEEAGGSMFELLGGDKSKKWERTGEYTLKEIKLPPFTLIGATTQAGDLTKPLRDRFQLSIPQLRYYSVDELVLMAKQKAKMLDVQITDDAARSIAERSRGVARVCVNFMLNCKDSAVIRNLNVISPRIVDLTLANMSIDNKGLSYDDREYLNALSDGKPKGVMVLAYTLSTDKNTIENVIEPYLLQLRFIERTHRGRTITQAGLCHIKSS